MRSLFWATALVFTASTAVAQPQPETKDGKQVFAITLSPMAAPKPLSNYYLTPQYKEQQPGDQLSGFMKCFMEQADFFTGENEQRRQKFIEMALEELPKDVRQQARVMAGMGYPSKHAGSMMQNMDLAARYTRTEWNEYFQARQGGINWLLPELQYMRRLAAVLKVRLRGEIKNGEFDRAIVTLRSMTGLSRMLETHPSIIGNLVGIAIQNIAWNSVEEMIQQPGCPNLFWSFVEFPSPAFNLTRGFEGERTFLISQLDYLLTVDRPLSEAELKKPIDLLQEVVKEETVSRPAFEKPLADVTVRLGTFAADEKRLAAARGRLVTLGKMSAKAVGTFGPLQVVLTDDVLSYQILRDEMMKYRNLPHDLALAGIAEQEKKLQSMKQDVIAAPALLPAIQKVKQAEARTTQRVGYMRVLEAIRLHATTNGRQLPEALDAIKLPLPLDPVTGKAFEYSVKEGVATLSGGNPGGVATRVYEIRLRK